MLVSFLDLINNDAFLLSFFFVGFIVSTFFDSFIIALLR